MERSLSESQYPATRDSLTSVVAFARRCGLRYRWVMLIGVVCALPFGSSGQERGRDRAREQVVVETRPGARWEVTLQLQFPRPNTTTVESLPIQITIKNVTAQTLLLPAQRLDPCIKVSAVDGQACRPTLRLEQFSQPQAIGHFDQIPAGKSYRIRCYLNEIYDLSLAGEYQVELDWEELVGYSQAEKRAIYDVYHVSPQKFRLHEPRRSPDHSPEPNSEPE